jgi:hypothetical protein
MEKRIWIQETWSRKNQQVLEIEGSGKIQVHINGDVVNIQSGRDSVVLLVSLYVR